MSYFIIELKYFGAHIHLRKIISKMRGKIRCDDLYRLSTLKRGLLRNCFGERNQPKRESKF